MMPGWMMSGLGMGYGFFGWLMIFLFWVLVIAAVVLGVRWFIDQGKLKGSSVEETPLDILKKRYSSGEIDKEEFETMRRELM
jgi:putative membrane protein